MLFVHLDGELLSGNFSRQCTKIDGGCSTACGLCRETAIDPFVVWILVFALLATLVLGRVALVQQARQSKVIVSCFQERL